MGPRVFLGRPGQEGFPRQRRTPAPEDLLPTDHGRGEELVLQIAVQETHTLHQLQHLLGFGDVPAQRLFAGHTQEFTLP